MKLLELFQDDLIRLPICQPVSVSSSFRQCLFERLDSYKNKIDLLDFSELQDIFSIDKEKNLVENLIIGIKHSIDLYLDGKPYDAYFELLKSFDMGMFSHFIYGTLAPNSDLYRLRKENGAYPLSQKELFHIPFDQRSKVSTQRYSIPGSPSLYVSNSVYVAWEELGRPKPDQVQACRLTNLSPIKYFDLVSDIYIGNIELLKQTKAVDLWKHLIVWPLIASCSVKVKNTKSSFKPEYIIPQLVLQIVRNNKKLDGIRFSSTHIDLTKMKGARGSFYNFVFPVKENKDLGYCNGLCDLFEMTEVVPWQIIEVFSKPQHTHIIPSSGSRSEVSDIELISGKRLGYYNSIFGSLEIRLKSLNPTKIITS